jgi:sugar (pentulose or hexulose) kinase
VSGSSIIVVDIGKTMSKVTLWTTGGRLLDRQVRTNEVRTVDGVRRLDHAGIEHWLLGALARYSADDVGMIIPVAHGAGFAALRDGRLAFPPVDYEQDIPEAVLARYRAARDPFRLTGSPPLPCGLNLAAQLHWLEERDPAVLDGTTLVPWAQYWAWYLSGSAVSEVTSLGCHSDLWVPSRNEFSPLAVQRGWADRFAPLARAGEMVGTLAPHVAAATGLSPSIRVLAGLHDSNAALVAARGFPEIGDNEATVLSTGTWFVAMRVGAGASVPTVLPEGRDCLVNVDPYGEPVPSARFMGGREIETVIGIDTRRVDIKPDQPALLDAVPELLRGRSMLLPNLAPGFGPFPHGRSEWVNEPDDWYARRAAACLYAALVADVALEQIGARDRILVEGRFAEAEVFVRALAALRPACRVFTANAHNDVSFGALRLIDPALVPRGELTRVEPIAGDLSRYRDRWHATLKAAA